jgi:hypothetical protein
MHRHHDLAVERNQEGGLLQSKALCIEPNDAHRLLLSCRIR